MVKDKLKYLVYGTLRGEQIAKRYGEKWATSVEFINKKEGDPFGTIKIPGFKMYSVGDWYPCVVRSEDKDAFIFAQPVTISDPSVEDSITRMELSAGYHITEVKIDEEKYIIFAFEDRQVNGMTHIRYGSWTHYIGLPYSNLEDHEINHYLDREASKRFSLKTKSGRRLTIPSTIRR
jgi:gamma-glutamylcyclotransferase (GGCT)/AIG2-like uncharacterized protein YtfP